MTGLCYQQKHSRYSQVFMEQNYVNAVFLKEKNFCIVHTIRDVIPFLHLVFSRRIGRSIQRKKKEKFQF